MDGEPRPNDRLNGKLSSTTMKVLLVDDNLQNLCLLQSLLVSNGFEVTTAANGEEALAKARQNRPNLILSDILMPVMDGFCLCHECKKDPLLKPIPFVFYTGTYTDDRDREFGLNLGAERFIVKPEEPQVIVQTIRDIINEHRSGIVQAKSPAETRSEPNHMILQRYNEVLVRKLEQKTEQLELANRELKRQLAERIRAESTLLRVEELLNEAQRMAHLGSWELDLTTNLLTWSDEMYHIFGVRPEEFGANYEAFLACVHPDDLAAVDDAYSRSVFDGIESGEIQYRIVRKDTGEIRYVYQKHRNVKGGSGKVVRSVGMLHDITERKEAERKLADERALLHTLIDNLPIALYLKDTEGRKTLVNPIDARNLGVTSEADAFGKTDFDFLPREEAEKFWADDQQVLREGRAILNREEQLTRRDGSKIWLLTSKVPFRDTTGRIAGLAGFGLDITERKLAEETAA
ncbi:MAG: PAS domain S-box protein, partial [Verrucomicrobiia bacterium]